jgi:hypothetical protein
MSNNKQTAIDIFKERLIDIFEDYHDGIITLDEYIENIKKATEQAKEMEKEQHGVTFHVGVQWIQYQMDSIHGCLEYWDKEPTEFETFYKETYGGNK